MFTQREHASAASAKQLDRQMRTWEAARNARIAEPVHARPKVEDFVFLSRGLGCGGREIAAELGQRLGWAVFDRELLHLMAGDNGIRERLYASVDERDVGWLEEVLGAIADPGHARSDYFYQLRKTVLAVARQGNAVFLGRAAGLILPPDVGLRVRLVASMDFRRKTMEARTGWPRDKVDAEIARVDRERAEFVRNHFHRNVDDPLLYDLTLNVSRKSTQQAVGAILAARAALTEV